MGSPSDPHESSSVLCELLRRTLSLVEYYGHLETNEASLFELKLALIRTVERLEFEQAGRTAAAQGREPDHVLSSRKAPHGETIDTTHLDKELDTKPQGLRTG
ncbi:MAG: hypothetical protein WCA10_25190 [Terracidiphilus sp.]